MNQHHQILQFLHEERLNDTLPGLARMLAIQFVEVEVGHSRGHGTLSVAVAVAIVGHEHQQRQLLFQPLGLIAVVVYLGKQTAGLSHLRRIHYLVELFQRAGQHLCRPPVLAKRNHTVTCVFKV